jgi:hypothetical protein
MRLKGMNYDLGWNNGKPEEAAKPVARASLVRDFTALRDEVHCTAVNIMGTDIMRLEEAATIALELGLQVWIQPRLVDNPPAVTFEHIAETARMSEALRTRYGNVTLNAGCEFTILMGDIIPGTDVLDRINNITTGKANDWPTYLRLLARAISDAADAARPHFNGPLTYAACDGEWQIADWSKFDIVNLDLYLTEENAATYVDPVREYRKLGKPVVVGEFGCGCFEGAEKLGGMCWDIVEHTAQPPHIRERDKYLRNDQTQADYALTVLQALEPEGVDGAFWYLFIERDSPKTTDDPYYDVEMASYGIVTPFPGKTDESGALWWEPKPAFHAIAEFYAKN